MKRAYVFHGAGKPFEQVEHPLPTLQPGELAVAVTYCTLCRSDIHTYSGRRQEATPTVLGHEIVGRIIAFGPQTAPTDARGNTACIGNRVTWAVGVGCGTCFYCQHDLPQKCLRLYKYGHQTIPQDHPFVGGLAEAVVLVPGTTWYCVPEELPDRVAVLANCSTATVAAMCRVAGPLQGRCVVVLGAGILGLTAMAMAHGHGAAHIAAVDPILECRQRASRFGASHTCREGELHALLQQLTAGRGADVVFELAGTLASVELGLHVLRIGGTFILGGTVAPVGTLPFNPEHVVRRMLSIHGVHNYHPNDLGSAIDFLAGPGRAMPFADLVSSEYPLTAIADGFRHAQTLIGRRVAIVPSGEQP